MVDQECNISRSSSVKLAGRDCDDAVEIGVFGVDCCAELEESSIAARDWKFDGASAGCPRG